MAVAIVNKKQTANTASATLTIPAATKGNLLVVAVTTISTGTAPTGKDNIGTEGWSVAEAKQEGVANVITWVLLKTALGGEEKLEPTSPGTIEGLSYFELSGASTTIDAWVGSKGASAKTGTSGKLTTTDAGDIVLGWVSDSTSPTGIVSAWTGTNPLTNTETASTRCAGGNLIPAKTLAEETFTANWETAKAWQMLVVAIKPTAGGEVFAFPTAASGTGQVAATGQSIRQGGAPISGSGQVAASGQGIRQGAPAAHGAGGVTVTGQKIARGAPSVSGVGAVSMTSVVGERFAGTTSASGAGVVVVAGRKLARGAVSVSGAGAASPTALSRRQGAPSVSGAGIVTGVGRKLAHGATAVSGSARVTMGGGPPTGAPVAVSGAGQVRVEGSGYEAATPKRAEFPGHVAVGRVGRINLTKIGKPD